MITFDHAWTAIINAGLVVLGWLHLSHRREIDEVKKEAEKAQEAAEAAARALATHQLYAADNYARKPDVEKVAEHIERHMKEGFDEIKDMIRRGGGQH